jgi:hypothetical protein
MRSVSSGPVPSTPQSIELGEELSADLGVGDVKNPGGNPTATQPWKGLTICSELDFKGLTWSPNIDIEERDPFALALNISGSFEGHKGWANLANNFDGQGISMGLLNQNLGQGTLQPMWIEMRNGHGNTLQSVFSSANLKSLTTMLAKWEGTVSAATIDVNDYGYSELDDPDIIAIDLGLDPLDLQEVTSALLARNQAAVNWAKATVYSGSKFKSDWSKSLTSLANSAAYRSVQVSKAEKLHNAALEMMNAFNFKQVNAYLFLFDIAVQNGGISGAARMEYKVWASKNSSASEETRMKKLLEIRLKSVKKIYVANVRARKTAIISGSGTVHGEKRQFEKEFCADIDTKL